MRPEVELAREKLTQVQKDLIDEMTITMSNSPQWSPFYVLHFVKCPAVRTMTEYAKALKRYNEITLDKGKKAK